MDAVEAEFDNTVASMHDAMLEHGMASRIIACVGLFESLCLQVLYMSWPPPAVVSPLPALSQAVP